MVTRGLRCALRDPVLPAESLVRRNAARLVAGHEIGRGSPAASVGGLFHFKHNVAFWPIASPATCPRFGRLRGMADIDPHERRMAR